MKYSKYQWPTDGATRKYVDKQVDKLLRRIQRNQKDYTSAHVKIAELQEQVVALKRALLEEI